MCTNNNDYNFSLIYKEKWQSRIYGSTVDDDEGIGTYNEHVFCLVYRSDILFFLRSTLWRHVSVSTTRRIHSFRATFRIND